MLFGLFKNMAQPVELSRAEKLDVAVNNMRGMSDEELITHLSSLSGAVKGVGLDAAAFSHGIGIMTRRAEEEGIENNTFFRPFIKALSKLPAGDAHDTIKIAQAIAAVPVNSWQKLLKADHGLG